MSAPAAEIGVSTGQNLPDDEEAEEISAQDLHKVRGFLFPFIKAYPWALALLAAIMLGETAANVAFSLAERYLIDQGLVLRNLPVIEWGIGFLGVAAILAGLLGLGIDYIYSGMIVGIVGDIRESLFARCQAIGLGYFEQTPHGQTLSRFSGDIATIENALLEAVAWLALPMLQVIYSMALIFYFNVWLGCVAALIFPVIVIVPRYFARKTMDVGYQKRVCEAGLLANISENMALQPVIRAFGHVPKAVAGIRRLNAGWRSIAFKSAFWGALVQRSAFAGLYILHVGVFALGAWLVYQGRISLGTLIVFEVLFLGTGESIAYVMDYVPRFAAAAGGIRHIDELLLAEPEPPELPDAPPIPRLEKNVCYQDVGFSYNDSGFRIQSLNLVISKGMKVAIVGPSGSGKSTLLGLLMRFRDPSEGSITLDGRDIRAVTIASLRDKIGFVPQQPMLFGTSIFDNIAVGDADATQAQVEQAAGAAEISRYIESLKFGYQTPVGEAGAGLSVGQRQRICIARALVRNPDILLLDEPTSALDAATGVSIMQTLWRAGNSRTVICATHNLAGIADAVDMVVVLENGSVREIGTHGQLLDRDDLYARLWRSQTST